MILNENIKDRVYAILAERRQKARVAAQHRWEEIGLDIPEIASLKAELNQTSVRLSKIVLSRSASVAQALEQLRDSNLAAQAQIRELLTAHGYPCDYLEVKYACPICGDTGYVNHQKCSCLIQLTKMLGAEQLNAVSPLNLSTFDSFRLDYYPDTPDENGIVPRRQMERVLQFCSKYAAGFHPKSQSLFMIGNTGLGKTHLSLAIARGVLEKGYSVIYGSAQDLFRSIEKEHFGRDEENRDSLETILACDLLILDDLGAEFDSNYYTSCLYNIVNSRIGAEKPTIITTNLSAAQLQNKYSDRIVSRLFTMYQLLRFAGKDIRQLKISESR